MNVVHVILFMNQEVAAAALARQEQSSVATAGVNEPEADPSGYESETDEPAAEVQSQRIQIAIDHL